MYKYIFEPLVYYFIAFDLGYSIELEYFSFESESKHFSSDCGKSNTRKMTEPIEDKLKNELYRYHKEIRALREFIIPLKNV